MQNISSTRAFFPLISSEQQEILSKMPLGVKCQLFTRVKDEDSPQPTTNIFQSIRHKNQTICLEIRGDYVLQKNVESDAIVSGFICDYQHKFEILRANCVGTYQVGRIFGINFKLNGDIEENISFYLQSQKEKQKQFIKFCDVLEKSYIIQEGFHKLYKAIRRVGKGASACVYASLRLIDHVQVAIKSFRKDTYFALQNGKGKAGFKKEFKMMTQLKSKYIVQLFSVFESQNSVYLVMQLLSCNLLVYIQKFNFPDLTLGKKIMYKLLYGIAYLHKKGIMHRDLKLQNIMIRGEGKENIEPVIVDLGLAQYIYEAAPLFIRCGTPGYVAPEIINMTSGEKSLIYKQSCDIFSLGVIFHILILGKPLFEAQDLAQLIKKNKKLQIDYQFKEYPGLPAEAKHLLAIMLEKDPQKRATAEALLDHEYFKDTKVQLAATCPNFDENQVIS